MKLKRIVCILCCMLLLTGCTAPQVSPAPALSLPAAPEIANAPLGDAGLVHEDVVALYLPSQDGQQLLTIYEPVELSHSQHPAQAILRTLLAHPGSESVRPIGGSVSLSLAGTDPVETAGGVCTVNLTPSALQLTAQDLYTAVLAIAATLCELDDIDHVNVLIAGQAVAMDVSGYLPLGSISAPTAQELPVLWKQFDARRVPVGERPSAAPLTAAASLYFPLADGSGIIPETRRMTFAGQHPQQLVMGLMGALADGAQLLADAARFPDFNALSLSAPEISVLDSGGKRVTLHFVPDIRSRISELGTDPACCFAALVNTLTTFVPGLQQVCILLGDGALTSVYNAYQGSLLFPGALHQRQDYAGYLKAQSTVYTAAGGRLTARSQSMPYRAVRDPRSLLLALGALAGPDAVLAPGLTDADILGLSLSGDSLLINLSDRYAGAIRESGMDQRMMAYSIVNTMCRNLPVRRVQLCFGGRSVDSLGSDLVWSGEFLHNPGLIDDSSRN